MLRLEKRKSRKWLMVFGYIIAMVVVVTQSMWWWSNNSNEDLYRYDGYLSSVVIESEKDIELVIVLSSVGEMAWKWLPGDLYYAIRDNFPKDNYIAVQSSGSAGFDRDEFLINEETRKKIEKAIQEVGWTRAMWLNGELSQSIQIPINVFFYKKINRLNREIHVAKEIILHQQGK